MNAPRRGLAVACGLLLFVAGCQRGSGASSDAGVPGPTTSTDPPPDDVPTPDPGGQPSALSYVVVDTGLTRSFDDRVEIAAPLPGQAFYGQDASYQGPAFSFQDNGDGTVTDNNTGLMWQQTPDLDQKVSFDDAVADAASLRLGGYDDWRLPTIKELYSLIDFNGSQQTLTPYLDTSHFAFQYGDTSAGERLIDVQEWTRTTYVGTVFNGDAAVMGVNFADGRIKGYPKADPRTGGAKLLVARYVRGNPAYGVNDLVDHADGTIEDRATGLMWAKADLGFTVTWQEALDEAENMDLAGHTDWRLPNAKELQSIVDYTRAPDAADPSRRGPAIDPIFAITEAESYFWTSTTHGDNLFGYYVCFGQARSALRWRGAPMNAHGAGAVRSDPKAGDPSRWGRGLGPQADEIRILNYVRCVRGGVANRRVATLPRGRR